MKNISIDSFDLGICVALWGGFMTGYWIPAGIMLGIVIYQAWKQE